MEGQVDSRVMQHVRQDEPDLQPDFHNMLLLCFECIQFLLSVRISSTNAHKSKRSGMNLQYNHWGGQGGGIHVLWHLIQLFIWQEGLWVRVCVCDICGGEDGDKHYKDWLQRVSVLTATSLIPILAFMLHIQSHKLMTVIFLALALLWGEVKLRLMHTPSQSFLALRLDGTVS